MSELSVKTLETSTDTCVNTSLLRCIKAEHITFVEDKRKCDYVSLECLCLLFYLNK